VHAPEADVTDAGRMRELLGADAPWPPLRGIVHAAGVFRPQTVDDLTLADLEAVLAPKVAGTWLLHELTRDAELDFLVLFSSAASVWGSALAGHYVAANHFLDVIAHHRRRRGLPALAVNWGWWAGSDMVAPEAQAYFAGLGLDVIPERLGFAALERLLRSGAVQRTVAPVDWTRFKPAFSARRHRPLLDLIDEGESAAAATAASVEGQELIDALAAAPAAARHELMVGFLQQRVGEVLGVDASRRLDPDQGFFEAGMDSITSVQLKTEIERGLGVALPATAAFEHPNIASLAGYLLEALALEPAPSADDEPGRQPPSGEPQLDGLGEEQLLGLLERELEGARPR
jgi:acyl carrier protein